MDLEESVAINGVLLILLGIPCVLGMTDWAGFTIGGKNIMDMEDFLCKAITLFLWAPWFTCCSA